MAIDREHPTPPPGPDTTDEGSVPIPPPLATRADLQLSRRLFHMASGAAIAAAYGLLFTHAQVVHIFGTIACLVYVTDQIRIRYPELLQKAPQLSQLFFRAEEQLRESAMVPFVIATLLTILTFPKQVALIAIYTLAIADPLSAIVGITYGKRTIINDRSYAGSAAFFVTSLAASAGVLYTAQITPGKLLGASFVIAISATLFEMIPLRLDDNLTIPLFVGFIGWICCALFGIPLG